MVNRVADHQTAAGKSGSDLYTLSFSIMVVILIVGFVANALVRAVGSRREPATAAGVVPGTAS